MNHQNSNNNTDDSRQNDENELKAIDELLKVENEINPDIEKAWEKVKDRISQPADEKISKIKWLSYAASFVLFIGLGILVSVFFTSHDEINIAALENNKKYILPDSSKVILAKNSSIYFSKDFRENREILLNGTAFFEVVEDPVHTFTVNTPGGKVEVLGTSFYVTSETEDFEVLVKSGIVSLNAGDKELKLKKGQHAKYHVSKNEIQVSNNIDQNSYAWNSETLVFENNTLEYIAMQLESYFDVEVKIIDEEVSKCKITGTFKKPELKDLLSKISAVLDIEIKQVSKDKIEIRGKGC